MTRPPASLPPAASGPGDDPPDEDDALAAEYVLGVLAAPEREAVTRRLRDDPALRMRVADWEARLAPLNAAYAAVAPPDLLPRIEARLFGRTRQRRGLRWWMGAAAGLALGGAVATALLLALPFAPVSPPGPVQGVATLGATLATEDGTLSFAVAYVPQTGTLAVSRGSGSAAAAGRDYELWRIGADGVPVSLGLLRDTTEQRTVSGLSEGIVLAVSLEPAGGSPGPAPTGPVLAASPLTPR